MLEGLAGHFPNLRHCEGLVRAQLRWRPPGLVSGWHPPTVAAILTGLVLHPLSWMQSLAYGE